MKVDSRLLTLTACLAAVMCMPSAGMAQSAAARRQAGVAAKPSAPAQPIAVAPPDIAVGAQYDATHVYVAPDDLDEFVASVLATFGGHASKPITTGVTPTPSSTQFQYLWTPVGTLSTFAYLTPAPFPFGLERTGYLVSNMDLALSAARAAGAAVIVEPFKDPIGMDALIEWPGGVKMQLYWHFTPPSYDSLDSVPENRVYLPRERVDEFVNDFVRFSRGKVTADSARVDAGEIGRPGQTYRRVRIESKFGKMQVMVSDGQLPYPFGYDISGYEVNNLDDTLAKANGHGAKVLFGPYDAEDRRTSLVEFPGGYIAEIHSPVRVQSADNPLGLRPHHITASVLDLDRAVKWYQDVLGFKVKERGAHGAFQFAELAIPGFGVALVKSPEPAGPPKASERPASPAWIHMVFSVADPDHAFRMLKGRGIDVTTRDPANGPVTSFLVRDSEGNEIEVLGEVEAKRP